MEMTWVEREKQYVLKKIGMNENGVTNEERGSYLSIFENESGYISSISNMILRGGSKSIVVNRETIFIENITIRDVNAEGSPGAGFYNHNGGKAYINNSSFIRNRGAWCRILYRSNGSVLVIENSTSSENYATTGGNGGAGGEVISGPYFYANNCTFTNNQGQEHSGALNLHDQGKSVIIQNCTFTGNILTGENSGREGAICICSSKNNNSTIYIINCYSLIIMWGRVQHIILKIFLYIVLHLMPGLKLIYKIVHTIL